MDILYSKIVMGKFMWKEMILLRLRECVKNKVR